MLPDEPVEFVVEGIFVVVEGAFVVVVEVIFVVVEIVVVNLLGVVCNFVVFIVSVVVGFVVKDVVVRFDTCVVGMICVGVLTSKNLCPKMRFFFKITFVTNVP